MMVNTLNTNIIQDGERNAIVNVVISGDGSGEESATRIVDIDADLTGNFDEVKILGVKANLAGFSALLIWDADTNVNAFNLSSDQEVNQDFRRFGGIINNAGAGKTGDILITTNGLGNGDEGNMILELRKRGGG